MQEQEITHFGYQQVSAGEKNVKVREVFDTVASQYDIMNDLMSAGLHRLWKRYALSAAQLRKGDKVLDLATGSADLAKLYAKTLKDSGCVIASDINFAMLSRGRARLQDAGFVKVPCLQANAEALPFADNSFDCVSIGFGLRNVTDKQAALNAMYRVLKPGGRVVILEFSKPKFTSLAKFYDWYSFSVLPKLGQWVAASEESYRYLAESIRQHPDQETLANMLTAAGFGKVNISNLLGGIVAVHKAYKF